MNLQETNEILSASVTSLTEGRRFDKFKKGVKQALTFEVPSKVLSKVKKAFRSDNAWRDKSSPEKGYVVLPRRLDHYEIDDIARQLGARNIKKTSPLVGMKQDRQARLSGLGVDLLYQLNTMNRQILVQVV